MNSYLLESMDSLSLQKERKNLKNKLHFEDAEISIYDLEEVELSQALEDLDTYGFLNPKKVIILQNIDHLKYDDHKKEFDHLFQYIKNPNPDNLLIIEGESFNNTLKVVKELKKICTYKEVSFDLNEFIKESFKGYKIDSSTIEYLREYCLDDFSKIENECNKLKNYKLDDIVITKQDIDSIVVRKLGDPKDLTFSFTRSLAMRDKKEALEKYHELLSYQIEPLSIIGLLASQIRIIYQVKLLGKKRMNDMEIAKELNEKSDYRIKKTRELTRFYSEEELLLLMQELQKIDYQLKTEDVDGNHLIEMFILNI